MAKANSLPLLTPKKIQDKSAGCFNSRPAAERRVREVTNGGGSGLEAVVFDLDGVLIDSDAESYAARRAVVAEAGGHWREGATRAMMGMSSPEWSHYLRDELGVPLEPDQINSRVVARLLDGYSRRLPLLDGAVAAVRRLGARWPLAIASSANRGVIDLVIDRAGLTG